MLDAPSAARRLFRSSVESTLRNETRLTSAKRSAVTAFTIIRPRRYQLPLQFFGVELGGFGFLLRVLCSYQRGGEDGTRSEGGPRRTVVLRSSVAD